MAECHRRRWPISKRRVWSLLVVVLAPALDDDLCLLQAEEDLAVEKLVPELAIEAFAVAVLPGAAWLVNRR